MQRQTRGVTCFGYILQGGSDADHHSQRHRLTGGENVITVTVDQRASQRFSPASTFRIPHTLFALDVGVLRDEFQRFEWDGSEHSFAGHDRDQDLRSAMRYSVLWVYRQFADAIGGDRARQYLESIDYGNAEPNGRSGQARADWASCFEVHRRAARLPIAARKTRLD